MAQNNKRLTPATSAEWLASCGFLFPTTLTELQRFDQLYGSGEETVHGGAVDPFRILARTGPETKESKSAPVVKGSFAPHQMVARKASLPQHLLKRLKGDDPCGE